MSVHCSGFHMSSFMHCHCQKPHAGTQWQLALSLMFKPSLMRNVMSSYVLQCEWGVIFTMLSTLGSIHMSLRRMTILKQRKWLSPIVTHRG